MSVPPVMGRIQGLGCRVSGLDLIIGPLRGSIRTFRVLVGCDRVCNRVV